MKDITIKISDISPRCLTSSAGQILLSKLEYYLPINDKVILDFNGITMFASLYFNNSITKLIPNYPSSIINQRIVIINMNETGKKALSRSLEVGSEYYKLNQDEKRQVHEIIKKNLSDWQS